MNGFFVTHVWRREAQSKVLLYMVALRVVSIVCGDGKRHQFRRQIRTVIGDPLALAGKAISAIRSPERLSWARSAGSSHRVIRFLVVVSPLRSPLTSPSCATESSVFVART